MTDQEKCQKQFNDWRDNDPPVQSELKEVILRMADKQEELAEWAKTLTMSLSAMAGAVEGLAKMEQIRTKRWAAERGIDLDSVGAAKPAAGAGKPHRRPEYIG